MDPKKQNLFEIIKFNDNGLIPAIIQDFKNNEVLMMAWMNEESLKLTIKEQTTYFFSRSRQKLWRKGESSGHTQQLVDIILDCDSDTILAKVKQKFRITK